MREDMRFKRAEECDAKDIHALQRAAFLEEARLYDDCNLPPLVEPESATLLAIREGYVLKALRGGRLAGAVRAKMADEICHVGRLVVWPQLHGQGIGTMLMEELEARHPEAGRFEIFTGHKSARAIHLYEKLGYRAFKTKPVREGLALVFMEKVREPSSRSAGSPCGSPSRRPSPSP